MARLFKVGHNAEPEIVKFFKETGWTIYDVDPARKDKPLPQWKATDFDGHMTMYLDSIGSHPTITGGKNVLLEYKTYNTKRFSALVNKPGGIPVNDDKYYAQVCIYLKHFDLPYCVFYAVNKNDSDVYIEIIERNDKEADHYLRRAEDIINSQSRPKKISNTATYWECKMCEFAGICHGSDMPDFNCRSCVNASPAPDGNWHCRVWGKEIPGEKEILEGCASYERIT